MTSSNKASGSKVKKTNGPQANQAVRPPEKQETGAASAKQVSAPARRGPAEVAARAYQLYQERGATHGNDQGDWHRAEQELGNQRDD